MISRQAHSLLAVDLDGTLIKGDILFESVFLFLKEKPLGIFLLILWLFKGKSYLKTELAKQVSPNVKTLPYNLELIEHLKEQKKSGAYLLLVTATVHHFAEKINQHLNLFDEVKGTDANTNLASSNKANWLSQRFEGQDFIYYGNSKADLAVWRKASGAVVVNADKNLSNAAKKQTDVVSEMTPKQGASALLKAIRPHQWLKNLLIFVPLLASHEILNSQAIIACLLAFISFSFCASSVYLLNDSLDIEEDRQHPTKKHRAIASGNLSLVTASMATVLLLGSAFSIAFILLPLQFAAVLVGYYLLTVLYSFGLKKVVMLDVILLALLYTVRVIAGAAATAFTPTFWILAFSVFIFLSLAFVKRYTELWDKRQSSNSKTPGRGYYPADFELLSSLGGSAGYMSVLVLALYINDSAALSLYKTPEIMWLACPILLFWLSRVWLIAHRGEMHDDPIVFAVKDKVSRVVGVLFALTFVVAAMVTV